MTSGQRPPNISRFISARQPAAQVDPQSLDQLGQLVRSALQTRRFRPPLLPEVAARLSRLVEDPDVDLATVEKTVVKDPAVAARIVAVANSAIHGARAPVTSLRSAIARLGLYRVRDVAFQVVAMGKVFRVPAYADRMRELFEAAQVAGVLARAVSDACGGASEAAYLCGLLHDMGEASVLGIVADAFATRQASLPAVEFLAPMIAEYHAELGALVCSEWKLPDVVVEAVACHHTPEQATRAGSLAPIVAAADLLLGHIGMGTAWHPVTKADLPVLESAGLTAERIGPLLRYAEEIAADRQSWVMSAP
jgi:HD-like signal output (HDOD) protein